MSQPQGDYLQGDAGLEQVKRGGMSEGMRRDPAFRECRTGPRSKTHRARQSETHADAGEGLTGAIGEKRLAWLKLMCPAPLLNEAACLWPNWHRAQLSALAMEVNDLPVGIGHLQLGDLRYPGARIVHQSEQNPISSVAPSRVIAGGEDGSNFLAGKESDERLDASFEGDGEKALPEADVIRSGFGEDKMDEAANRRQPRIARSDRVVTPSLQIVEKGEHQIGGERLERELVNRTPEAVGEKPQQQTEGISICGDGLRTDTPLSDQVVGEESLNERGELGWVHGLIRSGHAKNA